MRGWILLACLGLAADFSLACPFADSGARGELQFHDRAHMLADLVNSKDAGWKVRPLALALALARALLPPLLSLLLFTLVGSPVC